MLKVSSRRDVVAVVVVVVVVCVCACVCVCGRLLRMISGATYSGVPQNVHVLRPNPMRFAKPKSTSQRTQVHTTGQAAAARV